FARENWLLIEKTDRKTLDELIDVLKSNTWGTYEYLQVANLLMLEVMKGNREYRVAWFELMVHGISKRLIVATDGDVSPISIVGVARAGLMEGRAKEAMDFVRMQMLDLNVSDELRKQVSRLVRALKEFYEGKYAVALEKLDDIEFEDVLLDIMVYELRFQCEMEREHAADPEANAEGAWRAYHDRVKREASLSPARIGALYNKVELYERLALGSSDLLTHEGKKKFIEEIEASGLKVVDRLWLKRFV
ncbi:MAG: hypothetical protein AAF570_13720, partial [Bacteroidota bacterium]